RHRTRCRRPTARSRRSPRRPRDAPRTQHITGCPLGCGRRNRRSPKAGGPGSSGGSVASPRLEHRIRTSPPSTPPLTRRRPPQHLFMLQLYLKDNDWHNWGPISANGRSVGRSRGGANIPLLRTMAEKHLRFSYHRTNLFVEDLGSLNGVYVRITEPMVLSGGS